MEIFLRRDGRLEPGSEAQSPDPSLFEFLQLLLRRLRGGE